MSETFPKKKKNRKSRVAWKEKFTVQPLKVAPANLSSSALRAGRLCLPSCAALQLKRRYCPLHITEEEHAAVVGQTHAHMQPWFHPFGPSIDLPPRPKRTVQWVVRWIPYASRFPFLSSRAKRINIEARFRAQASTTLRHRKKKKRERIEERGRIPSSCSRNTGLILQPILCVD